MHQVKRVRLKPGLPRIRTHDLNALSSRFAASSEAIATCAGSESTPANRPPGITRSYNNSITPRGPHPMSSTQATFGAREW